MCIRDSYYPEAPTATKIYLGSISALEDGQVTLYVNENLPELSINQGYVLGRAEYYIADVGYFFAILEGGYGLKMCIRDRDGAYDRAGHRSIYRCYPRHDTFGSFAALLSLYLPIWLAKI